MLPYDPLGVSRSFCGIPLRFGPSEGKLLRLRYAQRSLSCMCCLSKDIEGGSTNPSDIQTACGFQLDGWYAAVLASTTPAPSSGNGTNPGGGSGGLSVLKRSVPKTLALTFGLHLRCKTRRSKTSVVGRRSQTPVVQMALQTGKKLFSN